MCTPPCTSVLSRRPCRQTWISHFLLSRLENWDIPYIHPHLLQNPHLSSNIPIIKTSCITVLCFFSWPPPSSPSPPCPSSPPLQCSPPASPSCTAGWCPPSGAASPATTPPSSSTTPGTRSPRSSSSAPPSSPSSSSCCSLRRATSLGLAGAGWPV